MGDDEAWTWLGEIRDVGGGGAPTIDLFERPCPGCGLRVVTARARGPAAEVECGELVRPKPGPAGPAQFRPHHCKSRGTP